MHDTRRCPREVGRGRARGRHGQRRAVARRAERAVSGAKTAKTAKSADRPDLFATFLTGISKRSYPDAGVDLNAIDLNANDKGVPSEQLRLNLSTPPTQFTAPGHSRLGVLGGDVAGFPNGRRLGDDVADVELQVLQGVLIPDQDPAVKTAVKGLGDGVDRNDRPYLSALPYINGPAGKLRPANGRTSVTFQQNSTSNRGQVTTSVSRMTPAAPGGWVQLYRINADGTSTGLGSTRLNGAVTSSVTSSVTKTFPVPSGSRITPNHRVFIKRGSAAQENRGVATTITVRRQRPPQQDRPAHGRDGEPEPRPGSASVRRRDEFGGPPRSARRPGPSERRPRRAGHRAPRWRLGNLHFLDGDLPALTPSGPRSLAAGPAGSWSGRAGSWAGSLVLAGAVTSLLLPASIACRSPSGPA